MPIETDEQALARAMESEPNLFVWNKECLECDLSMMRKLMIEKQVLPAKVPHSIFFSYMRFNKDGTFHSTNWYHAGGGDPILPVEDSSDPKNLGYWIRDMALHARSKRLSDHTYTEWGRGLEGVKFPKRFSYCVYFMDDLNWKFLMGESGNPPQSRPVVKFHAKKGTDTYHKHGYAFGPPDLYQSIMPNNSTGLDDTRQSMVMINRMSDKDNKPLKRGTIEKYSYDLWMRVRYAGSTNGITLIIDPGGENEGPPGAPPAP